MNEKIDWILSEKVNYLLHYYLYRRHQIVEKLTGRDEWKMPRVVSGKILKSTVQANKIIGDAIIKGEPFWVGRFGGTEMNMIYRTLAYRITGKNDDRADAMNRLCTLSGFFPNDIALGERFTDLMLDCCSQIDLQGEWYRDMEGYIYRKYQKNTILTQLHNIEPWNMYLYPKSGVKPWTAALKGKKVLVIHPFSESIKKQYENNRLHIFERQFEADDMLPEFELHTIKAVQTLAGEGDNRFKTWFEALEWMKDECTKVEFDVAIVGCGAYGYPLACEIKKMGKIAIHLAGATQILFGIAGKRWEEETPQFCRDFFNEYWTRPMESEKIKKADAVEDACYW